MVILGPTYQEQQLEYKIDRINATTYTRTWKGPKSVLDAIAFIEKEYTESIELKTGENNGSCVLMGRYVNGTDPHGDLEQPSETQEIDCTFVQQTIFKNEYFQALTPREQLVVRKQFENNDDEKATAKAFLAPIVTVVISGEAFLDGGIDPSRLVIAWDAWDLLVNGAESYDNFGYVLNRTRKCSRRYSGKLELKYVNTLWTKEQLTAYTGNPLLFDIPDLICTADETAKRIVPRWRMSVCRVSDSADGSRNMTEQWQLAKWSSVLYRDYNPS